MRASSVASRLAQFHNLQNMMCVKEEKWHTIVEKQSRYPLKIRNMIDTGKAALVSESKHLHHSVGAGVNSCVQAFRTMSLSFTHEYCPHRWVYSETTRTPPYLDDSKVLSNQATVADETRARDELWQTKRKFPHPPVQIAEDQTIFRYSGGDVGTGKLLCTLAPYVNDCCSRSAS